MFFLEMIDKNTFNNKNELLNSIPEQKKILSNILENINLKNIVWNGDLIDSKEYTHYIVINNWICIYEQQMAAAIVQGKNVVFE